MTGGAVTWMAGEGFCGVGGGPEDFAEPGCVRGRGHCRPSPCVPLAFSLVAEQGLQVIGATFTVDQSTENPVALLASHCMATGNLCEVCSLLEVAVGVQTKGAIASHRPAGGMMRIPWRGH